MRGFAGRDGLVRVFVLQLAEAETATFGDFDCPDAGQVAPKRNISTTALQALALLNSPFMAEQTREFAARVRREAGNDPAEQTRRAFQLAFARPANDSEMARGTALIAAHGLEALCRGIYNANEFIYID